MRVFFAGIVLIMSSLSAYAQKAAATIDLTGYWVAVVSEDWRFRMVTPRKGDYQQVPLTDAARKVVARAKG